MKNYIKNIIFRVLVVLAFIMLVWWLASCNKPKQTRALPKFSLKYDGNYFESNEAQTIKKYELMSIPDSFGYYLPVPIETYYLQIRLRMNTLATGQTFTGYSQTECGMVWHLSTYYNAYQWTVNLTDVSGGTATGTFSGYMYKIGGYDTIQITDGTFNQIIIQ